LRCDGSKEDESSVSVEYFAYSKPLEPCNANFKYSATKPSRYFSHRFSLGQYCCLAVVDENHSHFMTCLPKHVQANHGIYTATQKKRNSGHD
jgi:hypothetical protein